MPAQNELATPWKRENARPMGPANKILRAIAPKAVMAL